MALRKPVQYSVRQPVKMDRLLLPCARVCAITLVSQPVNDVSTKPSYVIDNH